MARATGAEFMTATMARSWAAAGAPGTASLVIETQEWEPVAFVVDSNAIADLRRALSEAEVFLKQAPGRAYWQSWKLYDIEQRRWRTKDEIAGATQGKKPTPASVRFAGLYARATNGGKLSEQGGFRADIYVFAFQHESDPFGWDALNLDQWEFYALDREVLVKEKAKRDSQYKTTPPPKGFALSLTRLRQLSGRAADGKGMSATELRGWAAERLKIALGASRID